MPSRASSRCSRIVSIVSARGVRARSPSWILEPRSSRAFSVIHFQANSDRRAHVLCGLCSTRKPLRVLRYNPLLPPKHQIGPVAAFAIWTTLTLAGVLYAASLGYGGGTFAATLIAFSIYFAATMLFAARGVLDFVRT